MWNLRDGPHDSYPNGERDDAHSRDEKSVVRESVRVEQTTPTGDERQRPDEPPTAPARYGCYHGCSIPNGRATIRDTSRDISISSDVWLAHQEAR
jgi:hypothetical protein